MSGLIVRREHLRTVPNFKGSRGFCAGKSREWFARHGLDWTDFLRHGIPAATLEATGDAFALAVVRHVRSMEAGGGQ